MSQSQRQARIPVYKKILQDRIKEWMIKEFLNYKLTKQGYVDSDILRTPLGTRIIIYAERPNRIIGRKGAIVKELTEILSKKLGVENPIIDVTPVQNPELNPKIIANRIAWAMTKGVKFRRAGMIALRQIMDGGAKGAEITISGKLTSERARFEKYIYGVVYKNGYDAKTKVQRFVGQVLLKPGIYGIEVRITPPVRFSDEFLIKPPSREVTAEAQVQAQQQEVSK
ncbi:MAG: 30S ribosomal protein S3 [Vulcanisaeta sp.]|jgi:small subunit ribosomal protein S3|nr:30S ribosomal protein S3 [Vulcanisaeta sp.]MCG2869537.1 30S ribosomal protein S3 [Vulcanisaeta sp.]MCG2881265.1 30S ribosomal protein S3 [Vulcanisaeta sp.]MCG2886495.1 30S ribosomal protein S3 [Vulcanisaeta sp.]